MTPVSVTPGTVFVGESMVTADMLNAAANPTVSIDDGSLPAEALNSASFVAAFGDAFRSINYLPDGAFHYDEFRSGTIACPVGVRTEPVTGWHVMPGGAAVNAERDGNAPDTRSGHSLKVYGATGCTSLRIGTYLPPGVTTLAQGDVVFSLWVYNGTGTAFTPLLEILTSASDGDEGNLNAPLSVAGTACGTGAWTRVSFAISTAVVAAVAWKRGAHLSLTITAGGGVLDNAADYVAVAQAALDKTALSATWTPQVERRSPFQPGMQMPWPGDSAAIPDGWLWCNGVAMSRTSYRRLFDVIGTSYGSGDGVTTFNLPDLRGGIPVGAEVSGSVQGRMEVELGGCGTTNGSPWVTVPSSANLRTGMGIFHANLPAGTTVLHAEGTLVKASANATATSSPVTIRFSKLGAADAEVPGAAGNGLAAGSGRLVALTQKGCSTTNASNILTMESVLELATGMLIDCPGVPQGTTLDAFITATTVQMSANATATAASLTATFRVDAPESEQWAQYGHLRRNPVIFCSWTGASPDSTLQMRDGLSPLIREGMGVTGAGLGATSYVTGINPGSPDSFDITPGTTGAATGAYPAGSLLTFSGSSAATAGQNAPGPRLVAQHWMIKF